MVSVSPCSKGEAHSFFKSQTLSSGKDMAKRISHDHKGSDAKEAARVRRAGGFISQSRGDCCRVNGLWKEPFCWFDSYAHHIGMLAITRALGDHSMKREVIPDPYQTTTILREDSRYLILACDGVLAFLF